MDVQYQERAICQHKFPPKLIETEMPGFSVVTDCFGSGM